MEDKEGICLLGLILCVIGTIALFEVGVSAFIFMDGLGLAFIAVGLGPKAIWELFDMFKDIFESVIDSLLGR